MKFSKKRVAECKHNWHDVDPYGRGKRPSWLKYCTLCGKYKTDFGKERKSR